MSFAVNEARRVTVMRIGRDQLPLLCVDDFSADPRALRALARDAVFIGGGSNYPGVRAPAPEGYVSAMLAAMTPDIEREFGAAPEPELELCAWSLVSTPPQSLRPTQRIPHFDGPEPRRIAFLHYLCEPSQGGTSFYRHRATGLEAVTPGYIDAYRQLVAAELRARAPAPGYASGETPEFERIHTVAAVFNRLLVYRGNALHSGDIGPGTVLGEDPRSGRLTINGFGFLRS